MPIMRYLNKKIEIYKNLIKYLLYESENGDDRTEDLDEIKKRLEKLKKQKREREKV